MKTWIKVVIAAALLHQTAVADDAIERIAFGSCAHEDKPQDIWKAVVAEEPDVFVMLGDNIYGDTEDMATMRAKYGNRAANPNFARAREAMPFLATWDDHDYGVNDGGAEYPMRDASQTEFLDFFGVASDSPRRARKGVYHAEIHGPEGKRVQFILLDTRYHRGALARDESRPRNAGPYVPGEDDTVTLLGEEQWAWLGEQLRQPAEVRIVASSIQVVAEDHGWEKWTNMPHERQRFFDLLKETGAAGVVVISGDRHLGEISLHTEAIGYPLYDVTTSGLTQSRSGFRGVSEPNRHRIGTMFWGNNFGLIEIDWDAEPSPRIRLQLRDEEGDVMFQQKFPLDLLRPAAP